MTDLFAVSADGTRTKLPGTTVERGEPLVLRIEHSNWTLEEVRYSAGDSELRALRLTGPGIAGWKLIRNYGADWRESLPTQLTDGTSLRAYLHGPAYFD